jgi:hypothetical protein
MATRSPLVTKLGVYALGMLAGFGLAWGLRLVGPDPHPTSANSTNDAPSGGELGRLQQRVQALERLANAEQSRAREQAVAIPPPAASNPEPAHTDVDERAPAPDPSPAYLRGLDSAFTAEPRDPAWSRASEPKLWLRVRGVLPEASTVTALQCRSSLCQVEVRHPNLAAHRAFARAVAAAEDDFESGMSFATVRTQDGDQVASVLYVAKRGYDFPNGLDFASTEQPAATGAIASP